MKNPEKVRAFALLLMTMRMTAAAAAEACFSSDCLIGLEIDLGYPIQCLVGLQTVKPRLLTFILVLARPRNCGTFCVDQG